MKLALATLSGAVALAFAQLAAADAPTTVAPHSINIDQQGTQNTNQIGTENQATQVYGNENQTSATQSGKQNQSAQGSGNQQSQQYGSGNTSAQGGTSAENEHNRQYGNNQRHDNGLHKGWYKDKHENKKDRD